MAVNTGRKHSFYLKEQVYCLEQTISCHESIPYWMRANVSSVPGLIVKHGSPRRKVACVYSGRFKSLVPGFYMSRIEFLRAFRQRRLNHIRTSSW